jgi:hypothetical protein
MIETRYDIEYIDPSSGKQRSPIGRFFLYSALTFSILAATAALIFSNLPDNTSRLLIDKVKALTEAQSSIATSSSENSSPDTLVDSELSPTNTNEEKLKKNQETHKKELAQQKLLTAQNEKNYKKEIDLLTQENTEQHEHTIKLVEENQTLTAKIGDVSKLLEDEKQKKSELLKKITALQAKNKTASDLLEKTTKTNKTYANELKNLKQKDIKTPDTSATNKVSAQKPTVTEKVVEKTAEKRETETTRNTAEIKQETKPKEGTSQVDAIVAAMEAANGAQATSSTESSDSK